VNPASIKRMGLMTSRRKGRHLFDWPDLAAQDLCTGVRTYRKVHHMQAGVAITASSAAGAGTTKSIRCCATSCTSIMS